jgi:putative transcriptional regulator
VESLKGQLLIAAPTLLDPNFARAVVLVAEHNEEGAMGVVLNRPSPLTVAEAVPELGPLVDPGDAVYAGGPVQPGAITALAEWDDPVDAAVTVFGDVGFLPGDPDTAMVATVTRRVRVFGGYAGWGAGQLEAELEEPAWFTTPALVEDVFGDPDELWAEALRRKGGRYALIAYMPLDPSVN